VKKIFKTRKYASLEAGAESVNGGIKEWEPIQTGT
jgi:hypothetical protein